MDLYSIPLDIWNEILDNQCDFVDKIRFRKTCRYFVKYIKITDLVDISDHLSHRLTNKI